MHRKRRTEHDNCYLEISSIERVRLGTILRYITSRVLSCEVQIVFYVIVLYVYVCSYLE